MTARHLFMYRWLHRLAAAGLIVFAAHYGALTGFVKKYAEKREVQAQVRLLNAMDLHSLTEIRVVDL